LAGGEASKGREELKGGNGKRMDKGDAKKCPMAGQKVIVRSARARKDKGGLEREDDRDIGSIWGGGGGGVGVGGGERNW